MNTIKEINKVVIPITLFSLITNITLLEIKIKNYQNKSDQNSSDQNTDDQNPSDQSSK